MAPENRAAQEVAHAPRRRVLVCMRDQAMSELILDALRALTTDQFTGAVLPWDLTPPQFLAAVQQAGAAVLVFDLWRAQEHVHLLVDALRTDEASARVPVVVLSPTPEGAERARVHYNVREALVVPCDLDELVAGIRRALDAPPLHAALPPAAPPPAGLAVAEQLLASRSREALFGWVQRLRQQPPWATRDDLSLADLLDTVPLVVEALDLALHTHDPRGFFPDHPDALARLQAHARLRRAQGIGLVDVVREYTILRDEVWRLFQRQLPPHVQMRDVLTLAEAINLTLDQVIEASIAAYLAAAAAGTSERGAVTSDVAGAAGAAGAANDAGPSALAR